jgi:transglutaminase-like putative cysteine protease
VRLYYFYGPSLFVGKNDERRSGNELLVDERVTTHFWSAHLERRVASNVTVRLLGRYGLRQYNQAFSERDTRFWTVGPHIEWIITSRVQLLVGYHYERGLAEGRRQPQAHDDISYVNHYASAELVCRQWSV